MLDIAVVGHPHRAEMATRLADEVGGHLMMDLDGVGCADMHIAALRHLMTQSSERWLVVLEDDAIPVPDFRAAATAALSHIPDGFIANFYLGTNNNAGAQNVFRRAIAQADDIDAAWLRADCLMSTVGYAVRRTVGHLLISACEEPRYAAYEIPRRITKWTHRRGMAVHYTWPSLVNHRDGWSIVGGAELTGRVAHRVGVRRDWNSTCVPMTGIPGWSAR